jgi:ferric-dicitrate binding protein FerR (iron transport regulator)
MDNTQALQTIEQALNVSVLKGVFNLTDVATILQALEQIKSNGIQE